MEDKLATALSLIIGMYIGSNWPEIKTKIGELVKMESIELGQKKEKESKGWIK